MFFFFQAEDGIRDLYVTGVQTCALPICGEVEQDLLDGARVGQHRRAIWGRRDTYFDAFRQQAPQHLREIPHEPREVDRPQLELTGAAEREELADHRRAFPGRRLDFGEVGPGFLADRDVALHQLDVGEDDRQEVV